MKTKLLTTELIINYLNLNFPEWTSHKGLGYNADSFLMGLFFDYNNLFEDSSFSNAEALEKLYTVITLKYTNSHQEYKAVFSDYANNSFFNEYVKCQELESLDSILLQTEYIKYVNDLKQQVVFKPSM